MLPLRLAAGARLGQARLEKAGNGGKRLAWDGYFMFPPLATNGRA